MNKSIIIIVIILILLFYFNESEESKNELPFEFEEKTLKNGLRIIISKNSEQPSISSKIVFLTGSKNDPAHQTGLAHYLEHLLFKGSSNIGTTNFIEEKKILDQITELYEVRRKTVDKTKRKELYSKIDELSKEAAKYAISNEFTTILENIGGSDINAATSNEYTVYKSTIPSNQLEKWLKLEYDRFTNPIFRLFHTELEVVYEEKNMTLGDDNRQVYEIIFKNLFQDHPLGFNTTIGTSEHLKNPSIREIYKYFNTYYVPNNMVIILSGDIDYDHTFKLIENIFSKMKYSPLPEYNPPKLKDIDNPITSTILGPSRELVYLGYRQNGTKDEDISKFLMVDMLLNNSKVGLIDTNLNQSQKVQNAGCFPLLMHEYSVHFFYGYPLSDQNLEQVQNLILEQIEKLSNGDFDEDIMKWIIQDFKISQIKKYQSNTGRINDIEESVVYQKNLIDYFNIIENLTKLKKEDIVQFVNTNYNTNYTAVYKRTGEREIVQVEKPPISKIETSKEVSDYGSQLLNIKTNNINPSFIDVSNELIYDNLKTTKLVAKINNINDLFYLSFRFNRGSFNKKYLPLACNYFDYIGTSKLPLKEKEKNLYSLGCELSINCNDKDMSITIRGIKNNFNKSCKLVIDLILNAKGDNDTFNKYKEKLLNNFKNSKLNKRSIIKKLVSYSKYGPRNPETDKTSPRDIETLDSELLTNIIKNLFTYQHEILYYGANNICEVKNLCNQLINYEELLKPEKSIIYEELDMTNNKIYICDYDIQQAEIISLTKGNKANVNDYSKINIFNDYFGLGFNSIIFQEIRVTKALAYSTYSYITTPTHLNESHYNISYIGTQIDKITDALAILDELQSNLIINNNVLQNVLENLDKVIRSKRTLREEFLVEYLIQKRLKLDKSQDEITFDQIKSYKMDDIKEIYNKFIKNKKKTTCILGDIEKISLSDLNVFGEVTNLSLEEIFGY
ncbi:Peptidase M16 inactive domain [seawater metagenome]|uniref:Peptidase M16 inactive domain n=1 Tax=seawater metagenome TaxID=1561972 RepID=A0A5E8CMG9_9ZZZZ